MNENLVLLAVFIVFVLLLVYYSLPEPPQAPDKVTVVTKDSSGQITAVNVLPVSGKKEHLVGGGKSFYNMTDGEKIQFILNTYFEEEAAPEEVAAKGKEDKYIKSLPRDDASCSDSYDGCAKWAKDGECTINPEYMLYNCPKSCNACKLTPQEKHNITVIYNKRYPPKCVNHGENYPGDYPFISKLYQYNMRL